MNVTFKLRDEINFIKEKKDVYEKFYKMFNAKYLKLKNIIKQRENAAKQKKAAAEKARIAAEQKNAARKYRSVVQEPDAVGELNYIYATKIDTVQQNNNTRQKKYLAKNLTMPIGNIIRRINYTDYVISREMLTNLIPEIIKILKGEYPMNVINKIFLIDTENCAWVKGILNPKPHNLYILLSKISDQHYDHFTTTRNPTNLPENVYTNVEAHGYFVDRNDNVIHIYFAAPAIFDRSLAAPVAGAGAAAAAITIRRNRRKNSGTRSSVTGLYPLSPPSFSEFDDISIVLLYEYIKQKIDVVFNKTYVVSTDRYGWYIEHIFNQINNLEDYNKVNQ